MPESVYKVIELVGTSSESWEKAAAAAIETAAQTLRDLRIAEVIEQDVQISNGRVEAYRVKMKLSFKYEAGAATEASQADPAAGKAKRRQSRKG
jgi:flavin-binding protein dodecin